MDLITRNDEFVLQDPTHTALASELSVKTTSTDHISPDIWSPFSRYSEDTARGFAGSEYTRPVPDTARDHTGRLLRYSRTFCLVGNDEERG